MTDLVQVPPSMDALALMERQAALYASSTLVPDAYRGKPADTLVALLYGRDLGMSALESLMQVNVIKGKPTLSAQAMLALVRRAGHSVSGDTGPDGAVVTGTRADGDTMTVTFGPEEARRAGLSGHNYKSYPQAMFWARAVSQLCRQLFSDALMGVAYTPEDLDHIDPGPDRAAELTERAKALSPFLAQVCKDRAKIEHLPAISKCGPELLDRWEMMIARCEAAGDDEEPFPIDEIVSGSDISVSEPDTLPQRADSGGPADDVGSLAGQVTADDIEAHAHNCGIQFPPAVRTKAARLEYLADELDVPAAELIEDMTLTNGEPK